MNVEYFRPMQEKPPFEWGGPKPIRTNGQILTERGREQVHSSNEIIRPAHKTERHRQHSHIDGTFEGTTLEEIAVMQTAILEVSDAAVSYLESIELENAMASARIVFSLAEINHAGKYIGLLGVPEFRLSMRDFDPNRPLDPDVETEHSAIKSIIDGPYWEMSTDNPTLAKMLREVAPVVASTFKLTGTTEVANTNSHGDSRKSEHLVSVSIDYRNISL